MPQIPLEMIDEAVARYQREREKAAEFAERIEKDGMTFWEGHGGDKMLNVTADLLADYKNRIIMFDRLIAQYEKFRD